MSEQQLQTIKVPPPPPPAAPAVTKPKVEEKKKPDDSKKKKKNAKPKKHLLVFDALEVVTAKEKLKNNKNTKISNSTPTVDQNQQPQEALPVVKLPSSKSTHNKNNTKKNTNNNTSSIQKEEKEEKVDDENSESQYFGKVDLAAIIPPKKNKTNNNIKSSNDDKDKKKINKKNLLDSPVVFLPPPQGKATTAASGSGGFWNSILDKFACGYRPTAENQSAILLDDYDEDTANFLKKEPKTPATEASTTPIHSPNTPSLTDWESQNILDVTQVSDGEDAKQDPKTSSLAVNPIVFVDSKHTSTKSKDQVSTLMVEIGSDEKDDRLDVVQEGDSDPALDQQLKQQKEKKYYANKVSVGYEIDMVDDDVKTIYTLQRDKSDLASVDSRGNLWDHIDQTHIEFLRSMSDVTSTTVGTAKSNLTTSQKSHASAAPMMNNIKKQQSIDDRDSLKGTMSTESDIKQKLELCKTLFPGAEVNTDDLLLPIMNGTKKSSGVMGDDDEDSRTHHEEDDCSSPNNDSHSAASSKVGRSIQSLHSNISNNNGKQGRYKLNSQNRVKTESALYDDDEEEEEDDISSKASIGSISIHTDGTTKETYRSKKTNKSLLSGTSDAYSHNLDEEEEEEEDGVGSMRSTMHSVVSRDDENELNVLRRIFSSGLSNLPNVLIGDFSNVPSVKMMKRLDQLEDFSERRHYKSKFGSRFVESDFTNTTREEVFFTKMIMEDVKKMVEQPKESALDKKFLAYQSTKEMNNTLRDDSLPNEAETFSVHSEEEQEEEEEDERSEAYTEVTEHSSVAESTFGASSYQQASETVKSVRSDHTSIVSCRLRKE